MFWAFYDKKTGDFTGQTFSSRDEKDVLDNLPEGMGAYKGYVNPLTTKMNLKDKSLITFVPDSPDSDHEWSDAEERHVMKSEASERQLKHIKAIEGIEKLEKSQLRSMRELQLDPNNIKAMTALQNIETKIQEKRKDIKPFA